jgi:hypothetical protein
MDEMDTSADSGNSAGRLNSLNMNVKSNNLKKINSLKI